jgi:hypothetical protein
MLSKEGEHPLREDVMGYGQPKDFDTVKYERDREHELALNEYTHNLEVEQLKLLILLNGGAATAVIAFAEKASLGIAVAGLVVPVLLWLAGLYKGAQATLTMREAQSKFSKFYRHRRHAGEARLSSPGSEPPFLSPEERATLKAMAKNDADLTRALAADDGETLHQALAGEAIAQARDLNSQVEPMSRTSLHYFVAGAIVAALVIGAGPFIGHPSPPPRPAVAGPG